MAGLRRRYLKRLQVATPPFPNPLFEPLAEPP
jgi:hypothetical protein